MLAPTDGRWRSARAGLFALVAAQIAVLGHVVAGGTPPDLPLLTVMTALLAFALRSVADRRRRTPELLAAMAGTQLVFHLVLSLADAHHMGGGHADPTRMLAFHVLAGVVSTGLLGHGEQLLFALYGWITRLRPRLTAAATPVGTPASWTAVVDRAGIVLRSRSVGSTISRRGPPAEFAPSC